MYNSQSMNRGMIEYIKKLNAINKACSATLLVRKHVPNGNIFFCIYGGISRENMTKLRSLLLHVLG